MHQPADARHHDAHRQLVDDSGVDVGAKRHHDERRRQSLSRNISHQHAEPIRYLIDHVQIIAADFAHRDRRPVDVEPAVVGEGARQ